MYTDKQTNCLTQFVHAYKVITTTTYDGSRLPKQLYTCNQFSSM